MEITLKDGGKLYYEVHGSAGEWLVMLNGIMMNTMSWAEHVKTLARHHRLVLLDFRDQARSSRLEASYDSSVHVQDVVQLLDHLQAEKVNLFGLSYGGQVALHFACSHQHRLSRLILMSIAARASNHLRAIGEAWDEAARLGDGLRFFKLAMPFIYSAPFYESRGAWMEKRQAMFKSLLTEDWFASYLRLSQSAKSFDVLDQLDRIDVPTLLLGGTLDVIAPLEQMQEMARRIPRSSFLAIPGSGHAAALERPTELMAALLGFLAASKPAQ